MYTRVQILEHHEEATKADLALRLDALGKIQEALDAWNLDQRFELFYVGEESSLKSMIEEHLNKWYDNVDQEAMRLPVTSVMRYIPINAERKQSIESYVDSLETKFLVHDHYRSFVLDADELVLQFLQKYFGEGTKFNYQIGFQPSRNEFVFS